MGHADDADFFRLTLIKNKNKEFAKILNNLRFLRAYKINARNI